MAEGSALAAGAGAPVLTADLVARVIVAAARSYGDDPVKAFSPTAKMHRRCLGAAAGGLNLAGVPLTAVDRVLGVPPNTVYNARRKNNAAFVIAQRAAKRAAEYAKWHPEARESVAGGVAPASVEIAPAADLVEPTPKTVRPSVMGPIASWIAPAISLPEKITATSPLRDRILEVLRDGSATAMGLATLLDAKELSVSGSLQAMASEGLVVAGETPAEGMRMRRWSVAHG